VRPFAKSARPTLSLTLIIALDIFGEFISIKYWVSVVVKKPMGRSCLAGWFSIKSQRDFFKIESLVFPNSGGEIVLAKRC
jgi:hypothetical protein